MADEDHLAILKQDVETWNKWRWRNLEIWPDLTSADLQDANLAGFNLFNADLTDAKLTDANLTGVNLTDANLKNVNLIHADLTDANLEHAHLDNANLMNTNLSNANLSLAFLRSANFSGAHFEHTVFTNARIESTVFADTDLSIAKGLESVEHRGPSYISIDTLYKSKGNIPEAFLRGCGLSDWEIEAAKLYRNDLLSEQVIDIAYKLVELRTNPAIQFYSCFISYSSIDQEFSEMLYTNLQAKGVRCWFAPEHLKIGDRIRTRIDEAIRMQDKLLLVLSETSIESQWVEQEVETALKKERDEKRTVLCPIMVDKAVMSTNAAWASFIKNTRHIGDFSQWGDDDAYQRAIDRLLRDLRAEEATAQS